MEIDEISEIGIDNQERLYVKPATASFPMIYREAIEINWDKSKSFLFSPKPIKWSYLDWYKQIIKGAASQGYTLQITNQTKWVNVPEHLQSKIQSGVYVAT